MKVAACFPPRPPMCSSSLGPHPSILARRAGVGACQEVGNRALLGGRMVHWSGRLGASGALQILDLLTEIPAVTISKMKVHPAMLMKTKKSRFQGSGGRCQDHRDCGYLPRAGCLTQGICKMKVHPAMLMKTSKNRFRVSGARCQDRRDRGYLPRAGCLTQGICKMKVHPAMFMKTKMGTKCHV